MVDPRRISVHQSLGGGAVADVLMWRRKSSAAFLLISASTLWFLFECGGHNLLGFIANVLLLLVTILFLWAKSASLLNRPLPPIPNLEMSEDAVFRVVEEFRVWINLGLSFARDIAIGRNLKRFIQVAISLWFVSYVGSLFNFLTLVYIGVLLSLSVPLVYDKYQDQIDEKIGIAHGILLTQYRKLDEKVLRKIRIPSSKGKKTQ
uniref:Reticulon-like protein n=1 Tax=Kalanchoe fedtschenkoi TaxID=63787 RepID=A0A7N0TVH9_KALFE